MSLSKITMLGFERWLNHDNQSLFDDLILPDGIDKQILIDNILLEGGEFEVLYSNPYSMRKFIGIWSNKYNWTFEKWIKALSIDYNPLENYDRMEEWTDKSNAASSGSSHSENSNVSTTSVSSTTDYKVNTYDDDTLHEKSQDVSVDSGNGTVTIENDVSSSGNNKVDSEHKGRLHGNIGVTTSQQMLQSELELAKWNLYQHITDLFIKEFCLMIY